ncbi:MAG: DUF3575 domain-containing protein [Chitinophagales bacterium]
MKKYLIFSFLLFLFLSWSDSAKAQKNVVKLDLVSLPFSNVCLHYERVTNTRQSLVLRGNYQFSHSLPSFTTATFEQEGSDIGIKISDSDISGWGFGAEYRFYTGKEREAPNAFYLAPFLDYKKTTLSLTGQYNNSDTNVYGANATIEGTWKRTLFGLQLGRQWIIKERFSIDWSFLGFGFRANSIGLSFKSDDADENYEEWKADIEESLEDLPLLQDVFDLAADNIENLVTADAKFPDVFVKTGITIGFAF